jgi:hypothetical protein
MQARKPQQSKTKNPENAHQALTEPAYMLASLNALLKKLSPLMDNRIRAFFFCTEPTNCFHDHFEQAAACEQLLQFCALDWRENFEPIKQKLTLVVTYVVDTLLASDITYCSPSQGNDCHIPPYMKCVHI